MDTYKLQGRQAFKRGFKRVPYSDSAFFNSIESLDHKTRMTAMKKWLMGWDLANINNEEKNSMSSNIKEGDGVHLGGMPKEGTRDYEIMVSEIQSALDNIDNNVFGAEDDLEELLDQWGVENIEDINFKYSSKIKEADYHKKENEFFGIEASGVRGLNSKSWVKKFKSYEAFEKWVAARDGDIEVTSIRELDLNENNQKTKKAINEVKKVFKERNTLRDLDALLQEDSSDEAFNYAKDLKLKGYNRQEIIDLLAREYKVYNDEAFNIVNKLKIMENKKRVQESYVDLVEDMLQGLKELELPEEFECFYSVRRIDKLKIVLECDTEDEDKVLAGELADYLQTEDVPLFEDFDGYIRANKPGPGQVLIEFLPDSNYKESKTSIRRRVQESRIKEASKPNVQAVYDKLFTISDKLNEAINLASEVATLAEAFGGQVSEVLSAQMRNYLIPQIAKFIDDEKQPGGIKVNVKFLDSIPVGDLREKPDAPGSIASVSKSVLPQPVESQVATPEQSEEEVKQESKILRKKNSESFLEKVLKPFSSYLRD